MLNKLLTLTLISPLLACSNLPPLKTEQHVDLQRFMGDWYVIANIPTWIEKGAHNAMESYALQADGSIATTFNFRQDSFTGKQKAYHPVGSIVDTNSNAVWGMQFLWPIKADYRIVYVNEDYSQTIIGRNRRDYVWVMARSPEIPDADYQKLTSIIKQQGYDITKIQKVPQRW